MALYYATLQIDYVWRWFRIPRYFVYEDIIETKADLEGEVRSISVEGKDAVIHIKGKDEEKTFKVPVLPAIYWEGRNSGKPAS